MQNGICPKCNSNEIVTSVDTAGVGFESTLKVLLGKLIISTRKWASYLCMNCGYFENFLLDREKLDAIRADPGKMGWKKVG